MRKIEKDMVRAIDERTNWQKDNTLVRFDEYDMVSAVFLHGNHIADIWHYHGTIEPNTATLARWPTPTTKSRLRALGVDLTQKAGVISIDGEVICNV